MSLTNALLATFLYSDIFDFPLTKEEIYTYFLFEKVSQQKLDQLLAQNKRKIIQQHGLYTLKGKEKNITKRLSQKHFFLKKLLLAQKVASILSFIPSIQLIGLSGSVAVENTSDNDDIDYFIVTAPGLLWVTRFLIVITLYFLGKKRERGGRNVKDGICTNMFVDKTHMRLSLKKQNIYTAHEVLQVKPLFVRGETYQEFLFANNWIQKYFKNIYIKKIPRNEQKFFSTFSFFPAFEYFIKLIQLHYMKSHRTTEVVSNSLLAFHPNDKQDTVLKAFKKKLQAYDIQI